MRELIEAKKRKTLIRLVSSDSNGDFTFQIGDAFWSGTVDPAVLARIEDKAKRAPGKALAMAKERTTLKKQEGVEDEMRDLLDRMSGAELDEARGGIKKAMFNDLKGLVKDLGDGMKVLDKYQTKELEKFEPEISAAMLDAAALLNSAYHKIRGVAAATAVMAGR